MLKLSRLTDYAVVVLAEMSRTQGTLQAASSLSAKTGLPEPTVAKILKTLSRNGLITSVRGVAGGYKLERAADALPVSLIIAAMEGPISLTSCVSGSHDSCALEGTCSMTGRWNPVNAAINAALEKVTLADMNMGRV
ncbi:MAG TPA: SUF system Fe-S cluster assembly regulator [Micavibrio sp.]